MSINLQLPKVADLKPRIVVIGVGGAGGNAVNNMIASGLAGVEYIVANTDAQALAASNAERRIQLGVNVTEGLGAGSKPEIGEAAAEEAIEDIRSQIAGAHMVFIAAGMGGGTGTGAAAVVSRAARELGILTVAIVTKPFQFEGTRRMRTAEAGIIELRKHVDTLIIIPNQNLFRVANEKTTFAEAFILADQVLYSGIACIVDLIVKEGLINLDFADVRTVMTGMGSAMMGTGEASGEQRAVRAAEEAIANPLLDEISLRGAKGLLLSIIGGHDMTLFEVDEAASRVRQEVDPDANIIIGATFDDNMGDRIRVAIVASGLSSGAAAANQQHLSKLQQPVRQPTPVAPPMPANHDGVQNGGQPHRVAGGPPPLSQLQQPGDTASHNFGQPAQHTGQHPGQHHGQHPGQHPGQNSHHPQRPSGREVWRGPGDVLIEEGLLPVPQAQARPQPPSLEAVRPADPFMPSAPEEYQRTQRRMPEVEDFPVVGQRDYRAKSNQYGAPAHAAPAPMPVAPPAPASPPPRIFDDRNDAQPAKRGGGLFQRLVGVGTGRTGGYADPATPRSGGHLNSAKRDKG